MLVTTGENEKRFLAETVQERLIGKKNSIIFRELLDDKIPTFLKNYLQNAVRKIVHTEEPIQLKNSIRFDFEYPKINEIKASLIQAFEEATVFSREELIEIINRTVSLQFDLLVRPNSTLLKIFYKDKSDRVQSEILQVLEGLGNNRIFIKKLVEKVQAFDQYHIVEDDFKKILQQTESDIYQQDFIAAFISEIKNFADFLGMIRGQENQKINIEIVKLLFEERKLNGYSSIFDYYDKPTIEIDELIVLLKDYTEKKIGSDQKGETDDIDNFLILSVSADGSSNSRESEPSPGAEARIDVIDKSIPSQEILSLKKSKITRIINVHKDPFDLIISRSQIERQPEGPIDSLLKLIDDRDAKFLIKRIFNNSKEECDNFIERLEPIDNWKKAKELIDRELHLRGIQPFSKEALKLGDLVFSRYFPERRV